MFKDRWSEKEQYIYAVEYYCTVEYKEYSLYKEEILPFATTGIYLEGMVSEISLSEKEKYHEFIYIWNIENKINEQTKQKQTHR